MNMTPQRFVFSLKRNPHTVNQFLENKVLKTIKLKYILIGEEYG